MLGLAGRVCYFLVIVVIEECDFCHSVLILNVIGAVFGETGLLAFRRRHLLCVTHEIHNCGKLLSLVILVLMALGLTFVFTIGICLI